MVPGLLRVINKGFYTRATCSFPPPPYSTSETSGRRHPVSVFPFSFVRGAKSLTCFPLLIRADVILSCPLELSCLVSG